LLKFSFLFRALHETAGTARNFATARSDRPSRFLLHHVFQINWLERKKISKISFVPFYSSAVHIWSIKVREKYSNMREIHKMCRICLQTSGSRSIFESSSNLLANCGSDLARICEKLRFVTMLKVGRLRVNQRRIPRLQDEKSLGAKMRHLWHFTLSESLSSLLCFLEN
jgi:hypothetical protein